MTKRAILPPAVQAAAEALNMSPAVIAGEFMFLTGITGGDPNGQMPDDPERQMRNVFAKLQQVLTHAGLPLDSVVEMTSYHVGLRDHFDLFDAIRLDHFAPPYPAWTAVEVAGLRREGAVIELRIVAYAGSD